MTHSAESPQDLPETRFVGVGYEAYHLSPEALEELEKAIINQTKEITGSTSDVVAVVANGNSSQADFGRTLETDTFEGYEFHEAMAPYENHSIFIYTVDLDADRIAHVKRVVEPKNEQERQETGLTGIEIVDDRLSAQVPEERIGLDEILAYHHIASIDNCLNITTNMGTGRVEPSRERPYSLLSYKAVFNLAISREVTHLFAYLNGLAIKSLGRLGLESDLMAGQEFHLPDPKNPQAYDTDYKAVVIPGTPHNINVFRVVNPEKPFSKLIAPRDVPLCYLTG